MMSSIIFGNAAIKDGYNAIQSHSYGPEQRGTRLRSDVILSKVKKINYPIINEADILIAMSQEAFTAYSQNIAQDALVLFDSAQVNVKKRLEGDLISVPATKLAQELGNKVVANIIMIGALIKLKEIITPKSIRSSIIELTPKKFTDINIKAFDLGFSKF